MDLKKFKTDKVVKHSNRKFEAILHEPERTNPFTVYAVTVFRLGSIGRGRLRIGKVQKATIQKETESEQIYWNPTTFVPAFADADDPLIFDELDREWTVYRSKERNDGTKPLWLITTEFDHDPTLVSAGVSVVITIPAEIAEIILNT